MQLYHLTPGKFCPVPYGENIQDQLGKPLFRGKRMPLLSTRQVGNRGCQKKGTKGKGLFLNTVKAVGHKIK